MKRLIVLLMLATLLAGCNRKMIRDDLAPVNVAVASAIAKDWTDLILEDRYPVPANTVFKLKGLGNIGTALAAKLRYRGYGVIDTEEEAGADSVLIEIHSNKIGKEGVLVSLVIKDQIISRSYKVTGENAFPDSAFSVFVMDESW